MMMMNEELRPGETDFLALLAIALQLFRYALAAVSVWFCWVLFRGRRQIGWLLLGALFCEPFLLTVIRVLRGGSLLNYRKVGAMEVTYIIEFQVLYLLAAIGLFLLVRDARGSRSRVGPN